MDPEFISLSSYTLLAHEYQSRMYCWLPSHGDFIRDNIGLHEHEE